MSQNKEWLAASDAWMIYSRELAALKRMSINRCGCRYWMPWLNAVEKLR